MSICLKTSPDLGSADSIEILLRFWAMAERVPRSINLQRAIFTKYPIGQ
jgi:hypothetical protein